MDERYYRARADSYRSRPPERERGRRAVRPEGLREGVRLRDRADRNPYSLRSRDIPDTTGNMELPPQPERREPRGSGRVTSLDGLRAFAIVSVLLYHMGVPFLPSGHMGVVVFLVLTGYLVTSKLVREFARNRSISVLSFLGGRFVRLWPSLAFMVLVTCLLCIVFNHVVLTKMRPDIIPSLTFTSNIAYIVRGLSYFDRIGGVSPLLHLWYLGLDAQFCVVWGLVMLGGFSLGVRRATLRRIAFGLAVLSAVIMVVLFNPNEDPSRVYYGFDTRVFAPLLGAWLGIAWPLGQREPRWDLPLSVNTRMVIGFVSLAVIMLVMVLLPDTSPFFYWGGMFLVAVLCAFFIAALRDEGNPLAWVFSSAPFVWVGSRSYALYLWHYPIFTLFGVTSGVANIPMTILALVLTVGAAEISYRLIESGLVIGLLSQVTDARSASPMVRFTPAGVLALMVVVATVGVFVIPDETLVPQEAITSTGAGAATAMDLSSKMPATPVSPMTPSTSDAPAQDVNNLPTGAITLVAGKAETSKGLRDPVLIGDSVPGFTRDYFVEHCPNGLIDSYVGRGPSQMESVLQGYLDQGVVGHVVILQAFSNSVPTEEGIENMIAALGPDRAIYLVTVSIPETEEDQINQLITEAAERHSNVNIIDWHTYSQPHLSEWLYPDLTHIREQYPDVYTNLITNAIAKDFVLGGGRVLDEDGKDPTGATVEIENTAIADVEE